MTNGTKCDFAKIVYLLHHREYNVFFSPWQMKAAVNVAKLVYVCVAVCRIMFAPIVLSIAVLLPQVFFRQVDLNYGCPAAINVDFQYPP